MSLLVSVHKVILVANEKEFEKFISESIEI